ncbi:S24 family peptidase [uncultured Paraglaciecola sp.]|uniref:S24 family peptidase n=1 Tax=uncultured Paraglaciecola sp. TaxID=1765024 RepID=UPI00262DD1AB|nr:S24 family peptidase [uncultured Paraglaciecola sp.]
MSAKEFCEFIFELRKAFTTRSAMAEKWPWHRNTMIGYERDRLPDVDYLYAISVETNYDFIELIKKRLSAGFLQLPEDVELPGVKMADSDNKEVIQKNTTQINDDSMAPTILKNAFISIDSTDKELKQGSIYAIVLNDQVIARRVQFGLDGDIILLAENSKFMNITVSKEKLPGLKVVGRIVSCLNSL